MVSLARAAAFGLLAAALAGCQTPCGRVASAICTIPGEESSCRFLRGLASDNEPAQNACKELKTAADAYALEPGSLLQKTRWTVGAAALRAFGWAGEVTKSGKAAGDSVKASAEKAADAAREAATKAGEAAKDVEKAAHDIGEALRGKE